MNFRNTDDGLMETAIRLTLMTCKRFPTIADIKQAIDEINRDQRTEPKLARLPQNPHWSSPESKKAFAAMRTGREKEFLAAIDYTKLLEWARLTWPEISMETVKRNANELQYVMEETSRCFGCQYTDGKCHNNGYYPALCLEKDGWMHEEMKMCGKRAGMAS